MKSESAYYSHSKKKYDQPIEEEEYAFIKEHFDGFVICPNQHLKGMIQSDNYYQVIATTSVVYASELNGFIGRGVYDECRFALDNGIPVWVIRKHDNGKFYTMWVIEVIKTGLPSFNDYARFFV
jgi:hypothetical protein